MRASWILVPLLAWLGWVAFLYFTQRRMIFPRHLLNPTAASDRPLAGAEAVALETPSGPGLAYWVAPGGEVRGPAPAVIFAHGNAELAREWVGAFRTFSEEGVGVLLVEYPGYGGVPGEPTLATIGEAMIAAYDHLAARPDVDPGRIVGLGRSLGGGAVTELARRRPLAGLVLQSTFTRAADMARRFFAPGLLVRDRFDNVGAVRAFDGPVLVLHGRTDEIIPWEHGRRLSEASERAELVTWECGHNDCPPDWTDYVGRIAAFAREATPVEGAER